MPTTPTSIPARCMGTEAFTDALNFGGVAQTFAAGTTIGGVVPGGTSGNAPVTVAAATTTLSLTPALHAGRLTLVQSTGGLVITPPAATGTGDKYKIACIAQITGGSLILDAKAGQASDLIYGSIQTVKTATTTYLSYTATGIIANTNRLTYDGTTKGGFAIGDWFEIQDIGLHMWLVMGFTIQSGTVATMFDNH